MNDLDSHMMKHIDEADQAAKVATEDGGGSNATDGWPGDDPTQQEPPLLEQPEPTADDGWGDDDGWAPAPSPPAARSPKVAEGRAAVPRSSKPGAVKKSPATQKPKVSLKPKAKPTSKPAEPDSASTPVLTSPATDPTPPTAEGPDPVQRVNEELAQEVARAKAELADTRGHLERQLAESEASKLALKEAITAKARAKVQQVRDECEAKTRALEAKCADLQEQLVSFPRPVSTTPIELSLAPLAWRRRPSSSIPLSGARRGSARSWTPKWYS